MFNLLRNHSSRGIAKKIAPYLLVILLVSGSAGFLIFFQRQLNSTTVALLFLIPVIICTSWWGLGPGVIAAILTFFTYNFLFLSPYYTLAVHDSQDLTALGIFLILAILISQLIGWSRKNLALAIAREEELSRLYEFSFSLTGINHPNAMADDLIKKIRETIRSCAVEIIFIENQYGKGLHVGTSNNGIDRLKDPTAIFPLETDRGKIGEIRLWTQNTFLSTSEYRLMKAFSAQGALALERTFLTQAESHSKVLEESDRLKSALLSSVSHELRTPLATIKAYVTSLLSEDISWDSLERKELLTSMNEETDHLNHLVGNLLDMSRIESGAMKPNRKWNLLSEIVEAAVARMQSGLINHKVSIDIPEDLPSIPVDYMQIEHVFTNLLSNSAKYSPKGSVILVQALPQVENNMLLVRISNQGPPVEPENLDKIFTKFYRVTNSEMVSGTGLGLSICKGLIEANGGRIWAENLPEGFMISPTLPLQVEGMAQTLIDQEKS